MKASPLSAPLPPPVAADPAAGELSRLHRSRIMMLDDEPLTMEVVQSFLEEAGYSDFVLLDDPRRAMDTIADKRPDLLLLDVMMPEISGFEILKRLRADPAHAHLPVIILTSSTDPDTKLTALDLGATDFLSKPVDPSELALRVRNTLAAKAYLDQLAFYDPVTRLPNAHLFQDRCQWAIDRARRDKRELALMQVSFNEFENINATFGPDTGNQVLQQVAQRFLETLRGSDPVTLGQSPVEGLDLYSLGRAQFFVLVPDIGDISATAQVGRRVLDALQQPFEIDGERIYLSANIGIAGYPKDADEPQALMRCASSAASEAARNSAQPIQFYSPDINAASARRFRCEAALRAAIDADAFRLHYQPKVELHSGRATGAEALLRWNREDGSPVSPADFIPVAEQSGLILPLGDWVIETACRQIAAWQRQGHDIKLSINISPRQMFERDLVAQMRAAVAAWEVPPGSLILEITEGVLIEDMHYAVETMRRLRDLGLRISLDDFGTGYSSLRYLKNLPLDELKVDRSFLAGATTSHKDRAMLQAIVYLGKQLGFEVCAEGVEEKPQLELLQSLGCDLYQGFLFSPAVAAEEFEALLSGD